MKNKFIVIMLIAMIFNSLIPPHAVFASSIKVDTSSDGVNTYYVSTTKENSLVMNLIKFNMETDVTIVYSGEMIPKSKEYLENYYIVMIVNSGVFYSNDLFQFSNNVGVYDRVSIKSLKYNKKNDTVKVNYTFSYFDTSEQYEQVKDTINKAIKDNIDNLKTDYEKAKWAYDWVIDNATYDFNLNNLSIYGGLTGSGMVCSGYAILYCSIATKLGLDCRLIEGSVNNATYRNHAWNIVKIDGELYCVDPTWGDYHGKDNYFLKSMRTLSLPEYGYHVSEAYNSYIYSGDVFANTNYADNESLSNHYLLPSVYNIEMSPFKENALEVGEDYAFMKDNQDNIPIFFLSVNDNVATVNSDGTITGISKGITIVIAHNYNLGFEQRIVIRVK